MKQRLTIASLLLGAFMLVLPAAFAFASATPGLYNGGLGQAAGDSENFGVAVCNRDSNALSQSVPVEIVSNGQTIEASSSESIASGDCEYSYVSYSEFGMQPGQTYSVAVTINGGDQATYSVVVPPTEASTSTALVSPASQTANAYSTFGGIFSGMLQWFAGLIRLK